MNSTAQSSKRRNLKGRFWLVQISPEQRDLKRGMIERAFGTTDTRLPSDVARPNHWADEASAVQEWTTFKGERGIGVRG